MGNFDSKEVMNPLGRCGHDCSRYCLDECDCDWQCGCIKLKIQTHHTPADAEHAKMPADEDFESINNESD